MSEKIFIVDDDTEFRQELCDFLEGYEILEASSGEECLQMLNRANEVGLILLDIKMNGLSGIRVLEKIKKTDPNLAIVILTGYSSKDVAIEALKNHADDYLEKPVNPEKLRAIIEKLLATRRGDLDVEACDIKGKIEKIKQFIVRNKFKKTTLKEVAACVYLSPKYLSRIFKQVTGQSYSNYKIGIKMDAAKELLEKTGYNVNQISDKLGYENTESFIRQFKIRAKSTPTDYRNNVRRKKEKKGKK